MKHSSMIKANIALVLVVSLFLVPGLGIGQTLHTFIIGDTSDPTIGAQVDTRNMDRFTERVASETRMTLKEYHFSRQELESDENALMSSINGMSVSSDDVIWFYYTGHGYNDPGSNFSAFGQDVTYPLEWIHDQLKSKGARLTVTVYEACNWHSGSHNEQVFAHNTNEALKFSKLFKSARGDIKIASNTAGTNAYSYTSADYGGLFTNALLNTIADTFERNDLSATTWENILQATASKTSADARSIDKNQTPYFGVNVRYGSEWDDPEITPEAPPSKRNLPGGGK